MSGLVLFLARWSLRRLRARWMWWWRLCRLTVDWVIALYVVIPYALVAVWLLIQDYRVAMVPPVAVGRVSPLATWASAGMLLAFSLLHLIGYGHIALPLDSGDRLMLMLSPVRRSWLLAALWAEGFVFAGIPWLLLGVIAYPWVCLYGIAAWLFSAWLLSAAGYESAVRLLSPLWHVGDRFTWRDWLLFHTGRWLSVLPIAIPLAWMNSPERTGWWLSVPLLWLATGWGLRQVLRADWDPLFHVRAHPVLGMLTNDPDARSNIQFWRRRVPVVITSWLESALRRRLHPVTWLICTRALRRKGVLRDIGLLSAAAVTSSLSVPAGWVKWLCVGFFLFLFGQWWEISIRPLYEAPAEEQRFFHPSSLRAAANRLRWRCAFALWLFWMAVWLVVDGWRG